MTIQELLTQTVSITPPPILGQSQVTTLDGRLILCHILGLSMEQLLAELKSEIHEDMKETFFELLKLRIQGTPLAYITGTKEFFGRNFLVDPRVLIPRPDTELLVETVLNHHGSKKHLSLHDCCTGSGCIAITLGLERPTWNISASDISHDALEVARKNLTHLHLDHVEFYWSDLLLNVSEKPDIITANPPYLTDEETEERLLAGWKEPQLALKSGIDGLNHIECLVIQASHLLKPGGYLYIEAGSNQAHSVRSLLENHHFKEVKSLEDLSGIERVTYGHL